MRRKLRVMVIVKASYLLAAFLFIVGLQRMASPVTARSGIPALSEREGGSRPVNVGWHGNGLAGAMGST